MESSRKLGGSYSTKHASVLLGVDTIFLSEALDTVRPILLPRWAHYFSNTFSRSLDRTNLFKNTRRQSSSAPSPNILSAKISRTATAPGLMPPVSFPSLYSYIKSLLRINSPRTWSQFLLTRSELRGFKLARHLDNDSRLLLFTQEQQRCLENYTLAFFISDSFQRRLLAGEF